MGMVSEEICSRIDREGYYEFVFHVSNRRAMEVFFEHLNMLYPTHQSPNPRLRGLANFSETDLPPIQLLAGHIREFRRLHPIPLNPKLAVLYSGIFVGMVDSLLRTFNLSRDTQVRLFSPVRRE